MKKLNTNLPKASWGTIKTKYPNDSELVSYDELTGSSKNFDSTVKGVLTKRLGGVNYNATTFTGAPKDQYEAIFTDGVHHLLEVSSGVLRFSSGGGTFTDVTSGYSSTANFEFTTYQDRMYFGNGVNTSQVYDRTATYGGVAYTVPKTKDHGAQVPTVAPTFAADTAGGSVPAGGHTYKITFLYYDLEESNGGPASALRTVANPNNTVNLTGLQIGGYGVTARKIYRDDNDGVYRLVGTVTNNTATTFSDTAATGTALIPTTNNTPPVYKYPVTHLDRIWIAGISGDPSALQFSEAGLPNIFPTTNRILCNPRDPITALVIYNDQVWVLNRNSIGKIVGRTKDTFRYSEVPSSVGCVDNRSIQVRTVTGVPTLIWLSDKGMYASNGSSVEYISDPIEDLVNLNIQQASQVKGQNAQTSQSHFDAGTKSPAILTTGGTITTPNPKRVWDDEADWEGGLSLTNIATNDNSSQISVPTAHAPAISAGSHANTEEVSGTLRTPVAANFTGQSAAFLASFAVRANGAFVDTLAQPFVPTRSGVLNSVSVSVMVIDSFVPASTFLQIFDDNSGLPGSSVGSLLPNQRTDSVQQSATWSGSVALTGGQKYWMVFTVADSTHIYNTVGQGAPTITVNGSKLKGKRQFGGGPNVYYDATLTGGEAITTLASSYTFTANAVATSGLWIGPTYDSKSDSAVGATISHTGTFPSGTSSITTIEASNNSDMSSASTETFANLNGSSAVTLVNKRYWRIKIAPSTTDDRNTAQLGPATLTFSTTGTWISEVIDHTTDITALSSLSMVSSTPAGTTALLEIATSANNITYTAFGSLGSATVQRYSKIRVTLTTNAGNTSTPTVTSVTFTWALSSNLISSAIDTGATPAGWDIFQSSFAANGGTVTFHVRTAATSGTLGAATFVAVTNGSFPTASVLQFIQWRATLTATADAVPTVDSVTINWFISTVNSIRVASLFYNRSYYLAAAEYNQTTNNLMIVLDGEGMWRTYRGITASTMSFFFNDPYYGSSVDGRIIRFLQPSTFTDQGTNIEMVVDTKAMDFGDDEHTKILRKVYLKGTGTGATYTVSFSVDGGSTFTTMLDVLTGSSTFTTTNNNLPFIRRFQPNFAIGNTTAGRSIIIRITESTANTAQIEALKVEAWVRAGELV